MIQYLRKHALQAAAGGVFVVAVIGAFALNANTEPQASPQRVAPAPTAEATLSPPASEAPTASATPSPEPTVASSDIVTVSISSIALDVKVSGATLPRKTPNCKGSDYCIDPPVADQAAWYGSPPSLPSTNPVLLFGHTSWTEPAYATFNNLPAVVAGDTIVVTTRTGIFTYRAEAPTLVPYVDAPQSDVIFGNTPEKLVLVTCNNQEKAATVIVGYLESATAA